MAYCIRTLIVVALCAVGCSKGGSAAEVDTSIPRELSWDDFTLHSLMHGGLSRKFYVYVPGSVTSTHPANGLVLFFHGFGGSASVTCRGSGHYSFAAEAQADARGFIAICPEGVDGRSKSGWNNQVCCGQPAKDGTDDVGFVGALLDYLRDDVLPNSYGVAYPTQNIFAFGFSTGGLFSYRLACELSDRIDGIAPTGATFDWAFGVRGSMTWSTECATSVPVWSSIGDNDRFTDMSTALSKWRQYSKLLSCEAESELRTQPTGKGDVTCYEFSMCNTQGAKSKLCSYHDLGHTVQPLGAQTGYWHTSTAWDFLASAVRNMSAGIEQDSPAKAPSPTTSTASPELTTSRPPMSSPDPGTAAVNAPSPPSGRDASGRADVSCTMARRLAAVFLFSLAPALQAL